MVHALLHGALHNAKVEKDPIFGLSVPVKIENVPAGVLTPRATWSDPAAYDEQAKKLSSMFRENFAKFEKFVPAAVVKAGPIQT
jgi:phosphoenolpyruvate carboxykinase (ATP)